MISYIHREKSTSLIISEKRILFMLIFLPFIIAFVILFTLILIINLKKANYSFDERQVLARTTAYKCAFAAIICYFTSSELVTMFGERDWCTPECNIGIGLFVSLGVFAFFSIIKDAYIPAVPKNKTKSRLFIILLLGGYELFLGIISVLKHGIMQDGLLNLPLTLCCGVLMIVVVLTQLIKSAFDRKKAKDED